MSVIDSLRQPGHTGENRCLLCIAVGVAFVVVVGLAVSVLSPVTGLVVLAGGALSVYLWDYIVPDTPLFAPQLVDTVGLAGVFDHNGDAPNRRSESLDANVDSDVILSTLLNAGVFVGGEDGLFLAADAHEEWEPTMATPRRATDEELAETAANAIPFEVTVDVEFGGISLDDPSMSVRISWSQAIADAATLYTVIERGADLMVVLAVTESMWMFVEVCPGCGGPAGG